MTAGTLPARLADEAARQAVGRLTVADALAVTEEAYDRGRRGEHHAPAGLLLVCLSNPRGIGWRLSSIDLRPTERAAMRGLVIRAHAAGLARRAA